MVLVEHATHRGVAIEIHRQEYAQGGIALQAYSEDGPWAMCTVCMPEITLAENEVIIKDYSENEGILEALVEAGIVSEPTRFVRVGYAIGYVCLLLS